jgi:DNA transformation protein
MAVSSGFIQFVLDQLQGLGPVHARRMFGGVGLYFEDLFFGLIADDVVYLKVDESTRERYEAARAEPFRPYGQGSYSMSYYEVPLKVLEDRDEIKTWARKAVSVAGRKVAREVPRHHSTRSGSRKRAPD